MDRPHHESSRWRSRHAYRIRLLASLGAVLLALNLLVALWPAPGAMSQTGTAYPLFALHIEPALQERITLEAVALSLPPAPKVSPPPVELIVIQDELVFEDSLAYLDLSQMFTFDASAMPLQPLADAGRRARRASRCRSNHP